MTNNFKCKDCPLCTSFHSFGSRNNRHFGFHCCVDGHTVFEINCDEAKMLDFPVGFMFEPWREQNNNNVVMWLWALNIPCSMNRLEFNAILREKAAHLRKIVKDVENETADVCDLLRVRTSIPHEKEA